MGSEYLKLKNKIRLRNPIDWSNAIQFILCTWMIWLIEYVVDDKIVSFGKLCILILKLKSIMFLTKHCTNKYGSSNRAYIIW